MDDHNCMNVCNRCATGLDCVRSVTDIYKFPEFFFVGLNFLQPTHVYLIFQDIKNFILFFATNLGCKCLRDRDWNFENATI